MKTYYGDTIKTKNFPVTGGRGGRLVLTELTIKTGTGDEEFCVLTDEQCRQLSAMLLKRLSKKKPQTRKVG